MTDFFKNRDGSDDEDMVALTIYMVMFGIAVLFSLFFDDPSLVAEQKHQMMQTAVPGVTMRQLEKAFGDPDHFFECNKRDSVDCFKVAVYDFGTGEGEYWRVSFSRKGEIRDTRFITPYSKNVDEKKAVPSGPPF